MIFKAVKVCAVLGLAVATPAFADLNITSIFRQVRTINAPNPSFSDTNVAAGPYVKSFDDSGGSGSTFTSGHADQTSDIQPLTFTGSGHTSVVGHTGSPDFLIADSTLIINFTTDSFYNYSSLGTIFEGDTGGFGDTSMQLRNLDNGLDEFYFLVGGATTGNLDCTASGLMITGHWQFAILSHVNGHFGFDGGADSGFENASITFTPTDTPEPASLSMLAIGATALLARRRHVFK